MRDHEITVHVDDGDFYLSMRCPFEATDEKRPCWPFTEGGEKEVGPQSDCVYESWLDNLTPDEILAGDWSVTVGSDWEWAGSYPTVTLHPVPDLVEAVRTRDTRIEQLTAAIREVLYRGAEGWEGPGTEQLIDPIRRVLLTDQTPVEEA